MRVRWNEHEDISRISEPSKHLKKNPTHAFTWSVIRSASSDKCRREFLESLFIAKTKPSLNNQIKHAKLTLFRHGVT